MNTYSLKIVTPQGVEYEGPIVHASVPTEHGFAGVLAHHAPYLTGSKGGRLTVRTPSSIEISFEVGQGFFEVNQDKAVFLTPHCKRLEQAD